MAIGNSSITSGYAVPMMPADNGFNQAQYQSLSSMLSSALGPTTGGASSNNPLLAAGFMGLMGTSPGTIPGLPGGANLNNIVEQMGEQMYGIDFNFVDGVTGAGNLPGGLGTAVSSLTGLSPFAATAGTSSYDNLVSSMMSNPFYSSGQFNQQFNSLFPTLSAGASTLAGGVGAVPVGAGNYGATSYGGSTGLGLGSFGLSNLSNMSSLGAGGGGVSLASALNGIQSLNIP